MEARTIAQYSSPRPAAELARAAMGLNAFAGVVTVGTAVYALSAFHGTSVAASERASNWLHLADFAAFWSVVVGAALFVVWTSWAYSNLDHLGVLGRRFRTGWAIAGWFVPILFFWRPKQVLNDTWRGSDPDLPARAGPSDWHARKPPAVMTVWWITWVVSLIADRVVFRLESAATPNMDAVLGFRIASGVLSLAAAVLAFVVIGTITRRQQERAARLRRLEGVGLVALPESPRKRPRRAYA